MNETSQDAETIARFWDELLSRQPERIRRAFVPLGSKARQALLAHLKRMATEDGWHPEQRRSAQAALDALADLV